MSQTQIHDYLISLLNIFNESRSVVFDSLQPHGLYSPWNSPGQNTGVGSLFLLHQIFPTQVLRRGLLHCRRIFYQLSYFKFYFIFTPPHDFPYLIYY